MSKLLTKIQYKICEKGEFFDEQERSVEETLQLIKDFPWDTERGADIQLSGPGIVIKNLTGDYLKVALYFNGKFSAYYLDSGNHLYEYHTADLNDECQKVEEFYNDSLNLDGFEKQFFNGGSRAHFENGNFEYKANLGSEITKIAFITLYLIFIPCVVFLGKFPVLLALFFLLMCVMFVLITAMNIRLLYKCRNVSINITTCNDGFEFYDGETSATCLKSDIDEINIHGAIAGRSKVVLTIFDLIFKDGSIIKIPGMVIDPVLLNAKLPADIKRNYLKRNTVFSKTVWDYEPRPSLQK